MNDVLPVEAIRQKVIQAWHQGGCIVSAPPGSGKTTRIPLWLLEQSERPIYLLIPKRIAVKLAAEQLARNLGETVGQRVGYRLRNDSKTGAATRIIVTTYGSFLRLLLNEPDQMAQSTIILDEFHERSVDQDLVYALVNQYHDGLDDSVRRVIMSATLDIARVAEQLSLPVIESQGFSHPVQVDYQKTDVKRSDQVAQLIHRNWLANADHVLVFCPGMGEIRAIERNLPASCPIVILHGKLSQAPDLAALNDAPPSIILATNIAESSITLARVHSVIDLGQERYVSLHPVTGLAELKTRRISQASAKQRTGRAGRLGPGHSLRLWSRDQQAELIAHQPAELSYADLTETYLQCAFWGADRADLDWLEQPPTGRWRAAHNRLVAWGAIDPNGQIRAHGKLMVNVGLEPWLGHFLITAQSFDCLSAAIYLAAHLSSQEALQYDPFSQRSARSFKPAVIAEAQKLAQRFNQPHVLQFEPITEPALIQALADRLVYQLQSERAILISGTEVRSKAHFKVGQWWLLLDGIRSGREILASAWLAVSTEAALAQRPIKERTEFDPSLGPKPFRKIRAVGQIRLSSQPCTPSREEKISAWVAYIETHGEQAFTWSKASALLRQRWLLLSGNQASWLSWPKQDQWLDLSLPFLNGLGQLHELSMVAVLNQYMGYANQQTLNRLCPDHWCAPSGRSVPLTYDPVHGQIQAQLKLQEAFGLATAPTIPAGVPIRLALTAPNGRPVAVVTDWSHFWLNIYPQIRKELRGRYAKHPWPDDPLTFKATAKTARQIRNPS